MMRRTLTRLAASAQPAAAAAGRYLEPGAQTGLVGLHVHAAPRSTLQYLYRSTLERLRGAPEHSLYRQSVEAVTRHRLALVDAAVPEGLDKWVAALHDLLDANKEVKAAIAEGRSFRVAVRGTPSWYVGRNRPSNFAYLVGRDGQLFMIHGVLPPTDPRDMEWDGEPDVGPALEGSRTQEEREYDLRGYLKSHEDMNSRRLHVPMPLDPEPQWTLEQVHELEQQIGAGLIEEVIQVAEGELKAVDTMIQAKVWEPLEEKPSEGQWVYFERKNA